MAAWEPLPVLVPLLWAQSSCREAQLTRPQGMRPCSVGGPASQGGLANLTKILWQICQAAGPKAAEVARSTHGDGHPRAQTHLPPHSSLLISAVEPPPPLMVEGPPSEAWRHCSCSAPPPPQHCCALSVLQFPQQLLVVRNHICFILFVHCLLCAACCVPVQGCSLAAEEATVSACPCWEGQEAPRRAGD